MHKTLDKLGIEKLERALKSADWELFKEVRYDYSQEGDIFCIENLDLRGLELGDMPSDFLSFKKCNLDGASFRGKRFWPMSMWSCSAKNLDLRDAYGMLFAYKTDLRGAKFNDATDLYPSSHTDAPSGFEQCRLDSITRESIEQSGGRFFLTKETANYAFEIADNEDFPLRVDLMKKDFSQPFKKSQTTLVYLLIEVDDKFLSSRLHDETDFCRIPSLELHTENIAGQLAEFLFKRGLDLVEFRELHRSTTVSYSFMDATPGSTNDEAVLHVAADIIELPKDREGEIAFHSLQELAYNLSQGPYFPWIIHYGLVQLSGERGRPYRR